MSNDHDEPGPEKGDRPPRSSEAETAEFVDHLARLTASGLPLPSGLRALATEVSSRRLRRALDATADGLDQGRTLDESAARAVSGFPAHLRGLIVAGAASGRLADVLAQYVRYAGLGADLRRRFRLAIAYPIFLLGFLGLLYLFVAYWIVGAFETILRDFGVEMPAITQTLVGLARATREGGLTFLVEMAVIAAIAALAFRLSMDAAARRRVITGIPLVGPILRWGSMSEFCHLSGLLVDAAMPLPEALDLAGRGVNDAELARAGAELRRSVEQGRSFAEALDLWPRCPAGLAAVIGDSEGRGDLAPALHLAGEMFESRTRSQASFAGVVFAAATVVIVLWAVGFVVTALYLPLITLVSRLSG